MQEGTIRPSWRSTLEGQCKSFDDGGWGETNLTSAIKRCLRDYDRLQTALDDANETLQLHQSRGYYEAGQVLGQKAAKAEIQRLKAVIEQSQRSGNLRCNSRSRTSGGR